MESYGNARFETKIETFDPCMIEVSGQRGEMTQATAQAQASEEVHETVENEENHEVSTMQEDREQHSTQMATVQSNAATNMTLTPVRLPAILDGEFFSVMRVEDTNVTVKCLQCQKLLNGNLKSTGNFLSHIKRVHPFMIEKIKCKSNQRKPAIAYIDLSAEKSTEIVRTKRGYRKCYKADDAQTGGEDSAEQPAAWPPDSPVVRRRKYDDAPESTELSKLPGSNSFVIEDEFDAIGRNIAAKLRSIPLDQRIVAEKLLSDVLFEAQLGTLHRDANLRV